jgi:hypothetical protein
MIVGQPFGSESPAAGMLAVNGFWGMDWTAGRGGEEHAQGEDASPLGA